MKKIRHLIEIALIYFFAFFLVMLPCRIALFVGKNMGLLLYFLIARLRRKVIENIRKAISAGGISQGTNPRRIARKCFMLQGQSLVELLKIYVGLGEDIIANVAIEGVEHYQKAVATGKSVFFISGHCGNWELMNLVLGRKLGPVSFVAKRQSNPYLTDLLEKLRVKSGNTIIYKGGALVKIREELDGRGRLVILMDQDVFTDEGYKTMFVGRDACTTKMPAILARETKTASLPVFIHQQGGQHRIIIGPEMALSRLPDDEEAARQDTQSFTTAISDYIKVYPEQWFWLQERWKPLRGRVKAGTVGGFPTAEMLRELRARAKERE
ncbi:MAG: lysophospholipid acyltransferase family protein [Proteobacteria bacterium]|nr:lysophospholipid acyltransferase family protein [Pseudomonadota bacterium]MBU1710936.1 lysophospholipid acyltransferase family protein [Pseudomonadota bacterium]